MSTETIVDYCPFCNITHIIQIVTRYEPFLVFGENISVKQRHLYCEANDEMYDNGALLNENLKAIKNEYAFLHGAPTESKEETTELHKKENGKCRSNRRLIGSMLRKLKKV